MSLPEKQNIVLIGMPGAGKSTIGVILAKLASMSFIDTDVTIQTFEQRSLQDILDADGFMELRRIEEEILMTLNLEDHVIATGGSAAYSEPAMLHLGRTGIIVFLDVGLKVLESRIHNFATRGLAKSDDQTFADLFEERSHLYNKYSDIRVDCKDLSQEDLCDVILEQVHGFRK